MCDPNVRTYNSIIKRCLYGNVNCYYLYEYIEQFWRKYQNIYLIKKIKLYLIIF